MAFFQDPPALDNQYRSDSLLERVFRRLVPADMFSSMDPQLDEMASLSSGRLDDLAAAHRLDEPVHTVFDAWGRRIDRIEVNDAWHEYARVAAEKGLVASGYERRYGEYSRLFQFGLVYFFAPSSQVYTCPLAMTDGCARTLEVLGPSRLRDSVLPRLVTRDPQMAWTSGQWMTERTGGSDVGASETTARLGPDGRFRLYGTKWFTSAVTSDVALTLARPIGNGPGGKGLALFFVKVRDEGGKLNGIVVHRLKEKLGTRHLPTAEITLEGTIADPVAGLTDGVRNMASMLNLTRTWNAVCAVAGMGRGLALARDYARRRRAFGALLAEKPLHVDTLAALSAEYEAACLLTFHETLLLGRAETNVASDEERAVLSVLQPVVKLLTGKMAVSAASEVLESFGGAGYVEDTGLPALLRDAQVLPIWEGTTNVLSLETLRALSRERAFDAVMRSVRAHAASAQTAPLVELGATAVDCADRALAWAIKTSAENRPELEAGARRFALTLGRSFALALMVEQAQWELTRYSDRRATLAASRFAAHGIEMRATPAFDSADLTALALGIRRE